MKKYFFKLAQCALRVGAIYIKESAGGRKGYYLILCYSFIDTFRCKPLVCSFLLHFLLLVKIRAKKEREEFRKEIAQVQFCSVARRIVFC